MRSLSSKASKGISTSWPTRDIPQCMEEEYLVFLPRLKDLLIIVSQSKIGCTGVTLDTGNVRSGP